MPLDLHVLSLPLAFILSQDQTLHCIKCFVKSFALIPKVLFEITHIEWIKLSCSIFSKNVVLSYYQNFSRLSLPHFLKRKADAKVKPFFELSKSFSKKLSKIFKALFRAESGAKITLFNIPSKSFGRIFRTNFSENPVAFQNRFHFLIAGAKIRHSFRYFQTFLKLFS